MAYHLPTHTLSNTIDLIASESPKSCLDDVTGNPDSRRSLANPLLGQSVVACLNGFSDTRESDWRISCEDLCQYMSASSTNCSLTRVNSRREDEMLIELSIR